jgi:lipoprotein-anchoring transpeptidase ErfK/SrfK
MVDNGNKRLSRREFLKFGLTGLGAAALNPGENWRNLLQDWPDAERLGRNCVGGMINLRAKPSADSNTIKKLYEDSIIVWLREVVGDAPAGVLSRRWIETPEGYIYAPSVQPVKNQPNMPAAILPNNGKTMGMWAEVTVPYVDITLANPPARSPWFKEVVNPRLYYSQVMWIDDLKLDQQGKTFYRVSERHGTYGDIFWAEAEAFRQITEEEMAPLRPDVEEKTVVVDVNHQVLSCYEGKSEVYFCRVSTGAKFDAKGNAVDEWSTPLGPHPIWRKLVSIHMSGGGTGAGWDTPGIGWTSLFAGEGMAVHSTFWHNDFGTPRSHGCVNTNPEDAKWIFRWTTPKTPYDPGDITVQMPGGTIVNILEG